MIKLLKKYVDPKTLPIWLKYMNYYIYQSMIQLEDIIVTETQVILVSGICSA